jgi:hypothetical protein
MQFWVSLGVSPPHWKWQRSVARATPTGSTDVLYQVFGIHFSASEANAAGLRQWAISVGYAHVNSTSCTACYRTRVATRSALTSQSARSSMSGSLCITPFFRRSTIDRSKPIYIEILLNVRVLASHAWWSHVDLSNIPVKDSVQCRTHLLAREE